MDLTSILIAVMMAGWLIVALYISYRRDVSQWNDGRCGACNDEMSCTGSVDRQGAREWACFNCDQRIWISWQVDKNNPFR